MHDQPVQLLVMLWLKLLTVHKTASLMDFLPGLRETQLISLHFSVSRHSFSVASCNHLFNMIFIFLAFPVNSLD